MVFGYFLFIFFFFHDPIRDPVCDPVHDPVHILSTPDKFIHVVKLDACKMHVIYPHTSSQCFFKCKNKLL